MAYFIITGTDKLQKGRIHTLEVRPAALKNGRWEIGLPFTLSSGLIVDRMVAGDVYSSATWSEDRGHWIEGQNVGFNLYSHADGKLANNLGSLPEVSWKATVQTEKPAWAAYYVTGSDKGGDGTHHRVEVRPIIPRAGMIVPGDPVAVTSGWVVDAINQRVAFHTATRIPWADTYLRGAAVDYYLRTEADDKLTNNLDELPPIGLAQKAIRRSTTI